MSQTSLEVLSTAQIDWEPAGNLLWKSCNSNFFLLCFKGTDIPTPDISLINAMQHPTSGFNSIIKTKKNFTVPVIGN